MLGAEEFSVGTIGDATPLALILPRNEHEPTALIGRATQGDARAIFFLDDRNLFKSFECAGNSHWTGLQIQGVRIEVDETSAFDPERQWPKAGCVLRQSTQLLAVAAGNFQSSRGTELVLLVDDLAPASHKAAFSRWQISLGQGFEKRVLHSIDADK
ncbi:hypothetical protein [Luteimonas kalidii]|uniref:Phytase-like domain-containing protein n=1 Tax=Luteimonas kalidii TaxID=3042025 RepID=A0ABT6JX50_9GAMM|nr:hypothetical protein [Luteimonas kalidii]MDH5835270.1 hypothetical protein [Luteimonas kalidii]